MRFVYENFLMMIICL